ncbi:hypothetical protein M5E89_01395 [Acidaminococcus intestini]|nr:hypothetical protein M5E89_01395 [Acidaminococcus intestini]
MDILTNPIVISVVVMSALCLMKMNVLLAILISGVIAGLTGGMDLPKTFSTLIAGMGKLGNGFELHSAGNLGRCHWPLRVG